MTNLKIENVSNNARALTDEEISALLEGPTIARLATVRPDGRPHISPMFFLYRDGLVYFMQRKNTAKKKIDNLRQNPHVALSIDTCEPPYLAVLIEGTADVTEENVDEIAMAISIKYEGEEAGRERQRQLHEESPLWLIRVRPTRIMHFQT
jgi:PPOX class probable F420-dependent enzyme